MYTLSGWAVPGGQPDFALRHCQPGYRIHHQQDAGALVAEIFRHRQRHETGAHAQRRRPLGSGADHHRAFASVRPQLFFEKAAHLAIAFADHADDRDIGGIVARHGAQQSALADSAAPENAETLPLSARQQTVDGADAGDQRLGDVFAVERIAGLAVQTVGIPHFQLRAAVDGFPKTVEDAAQ